MSAVIELLLKERDRRSLPTEGPTPLYHQMYTLLRSAILDGSISHGTQMPTEQQLAEAFEVSRITAKRAMDELAAEGLVERRRGKGTHVIHKYKPKPVQAPLVGMLENLESMGRHTRIRVLDVGELIPPADVRAELGLGEKETAHRVIRVRSSEEEHQPFAFYTSWTTGIRKGFTAKVLEKTPRLEVIRKNGVKLEKVEQTLSAELASAEVARELDMRPGEPLLVLVRRSYDSKGQLVDILHGLYNPKRFQYRMSLSLNDGDKGEG